MENALVVIAAVALGIMGGVFAGIHTGIYWSAVLTPEGACEAYRFSLYVCESLK